MPILALLVDSGQGTNVKTPRCKDFRTVRLKAHTMNNFVYMFSWYQITQQTLEHPGVKAPGTANSTPFFPLKRSAMLTFSPGLFSFTSIDGSLSPTWKNISKSRLVSQDTYIPTWQLVDDDATNICHEM